MKAPENIPPFIAGAPQLSTVSLNRMREAAERVERTPDRESGAGGFLTYKNVGAQTAGIGCPLVTDRSGNSTGMTAQNHLALQTPQDAARDVDLVLFVNRTTDVAANGYGICECLLPLFWVRVDVACSVLDSVGTKGSATAKATFAKDVPGARVVAYYGDHYGDGDLWAYVVFDVATLLKSKDDPGDPAADQQTFNTADSDGGAGTVDLLGDVPGS